jgi:hypothetical protein
MFQIILCVVLFILVYLMFITWMLHISPTTSTIDGIAVCTWYKTSGVYMVQDVRCVHGTRHVETDLRPSVKGHSFSENSRVLTVEKNSDTQLVIFYLYSQSVSDIRNTTQIIQLPFLSLFVSSWSLAQPTDDLTRSVVAEQLLHISIPRWGGHFQSRQHTLYNM